MLPDPAGIEPATSWLPVGRTYARTKRNRTWGTAFEWSVKNNKDGLGVGRGRGRGWGWGLKPVLLARNVTVNSDAALNCKHMRSSTSLWNAYSYKHYEDIQFYYPLMCVDICGWTAKSADHDQTPCPVASDLGLHCLARPVCPNRVNMCT